MITRRNALQSIALASLTGCAVRRSPTVARYTGPALAPVIVSPERLIRTVTGLRPFRPSGFVVGVEKRGGKTIIHNYGHGGGGMTLSWGTPHLAVEEAAKLGATQFAVLGCGGVGLATARLLQRRGYTVTIYAKDLPPDTTSNIAGAQWSPFSVFDADKRTPEFLARFTRAAQLSYRAFQDLVGPYYGVRWIPNYLLSDWPSGLFAPGGMFESIAGLYPDTKQLGRNEHPFSAPYALRFMTMLIEPPVYLNAILRDYLIAGGKLVVREFDGIESILQLPEPAIVNCTGLGAKKLFADEELIPIKGQLSFLLPQPEVDYIVLSGGLYMFPRGDGILLGGTHERGVWTLDPDPATQTRIVAGHRELFQAMRLS